MQLPHTEPIRFAFDIKSVDEENSIVSCKFPYAPTLPMLCEAAAQSSASFASKDEKPKMGFLISLKNIEQIEETKDLEYLINITKGLNFGSMTEFLFQVENEEEKIFAKGALTVAIQDEDSN